MKTLIIIRHAKSDQFTRSKDIERPLNDRGNSDAPVMAARLFAELPDIDAWASSPAVRTTQTAAYFVQQYGKVVSDIQFVPSLYHAASSTIQNVITGLPDNLKTVCLFTHNPGVTEFVNDMIPLHAVDNMPTCGVFAFRVDTDSWIQLSNAKKKFLFFDYPKKGG